MSFTFKDVSSDEHGVVVTSLPPITVAQRRVTQHVIPGRSGALHVDDHAWDESLLPVEGYLPYEQGVYVSDTSAISAWLQGSGWLAFSDQPGVRYRARVSDAISFTPLMIGFADRLFSVSFWCYPLKYATNNASVSLTQSGYVNNIGTVWAEPLITVYGTGDINLLIGSTSILLDDVDDSITIDCGQRLAYKGALLQCHKTTLVDDTWPRLDVGANAVSWTGNVTGVSITPNARYV